MIVMKFGGSSVESAKAIQRVAAIVREHLQQHPAVVVSAMGKTTDRLVGIARLTAAGNTQAAGSEMAKLRRFHLTETSYLARAADAIRLDRDICCLFDELEQVLLRISESRSLTPLLSDAVLSFGERLSSLIVTAGLRQAGIDAVHLDAREAIVTDANHSEAAPLLIETYALLRRKVSGDQVTVMGGFIGATEDGITTTLGRGGSDYSAAIVGAALCAHEIQIWTDVDGMLTCDPRVVPAAHCLRSVSYAEAEQMAKSGAKVLHPATVLPAVRAGIPIAIRNSRNPKAPGTTIVSESPCDGAVLSIACRTGISLLHLTPRTTPVTADFGSEIWDAFQRAGARFELIATSRKELSVVVDSAMLTPEFLARLNQLAEVETEGNRALLTLVGQNASRNPSNLTRASHRLSKLAGGAMLGWCSDSRFAFVVDEQALGAAAETLHHEFFTQPDPSLFVRNRTSVTTFETTCRRPVSAMAVNPIQ
jgi:aspartate kinase